MQKKIAKNTRKVIDITEDNVEKVQ